eukprot:141328-Pyramimonas_sp.AAC.1
MNWLPTSLGYLGSLGRILAGGSGAPGGPRNLHQEGLEMAPMRPQEGPQNAPDGCCNRWVRCSIRWGASSGSLGALLRAVLRL